MTCPVSVVYDGSAQTTWTVAVTDADGLNLSPTPIYTLNSDVGTVTAGYTFAGDANHTGSSDSTAFDITEATCDHGRDLPGQRRVRRLGPDAVHRARSPAPVDSA